MTFGRARGSLIFSVAVVRDDDGAQTFTMGKGIGGGRHGVSTDTLIYNGCSPEKALKLCHFVAAGSSSKVGLCRLYAE